MICLDCGNMDIRYDEKEKSYHCNNCGSRNIGTRKEGCKYMLGNGLCGKSRHVRHLENVKHYVVIMKNSRKPSFHVEGMNNMNDVLEQRLAAKKRDLKNQQEYFRIDMKNIEQSNYEDNAINTLLYMKKLKTEIAELELVMQLKKTNGL